MAKTLILCDCAGSQHVDGEAIAKGAGVSCSRVHQALCTSELASAAQFLQEGDVVVACTQEQATFEDLASELDVEMPGFVDLRDRAGWSDEGPAAVAKMAALAAEAMVPVQVTPSVDVTSDGVCLVTGPAEPAFELAAMLADALAVTVLVTDQGELPADRRFDVIRGRIRHLRGALGGFDLTIDGLQLQ